MKKLMISLFLISLIYVCNCLKENNLKVEEKSKEVLELRKFSQSDEDLMKQLFSTMPIKCKSEQSLLDEAQAKAKKKSNKIKNKYVKASKAELWWVKQWGFGPSSYVFDFITPVLKDDFISEAQSIYNEAFSKDNTKDGSYVDPFDYKNFISDDMTDNEKEKFMKDFKLINANYVKEIFDISINAVQLHKAMKEWKWVNNPSTDYSKDLIDNYDADGDGRLNPREFLLATIDYNKNNFGVSGVKNAFNQCYLKLNAMFTFIDCDDDGYVSSEELWKNLRNLIRPDPTVYNIFGANQSSRLSSINDFVLKSFSSKNGLLSKQDFILGILYGFWNRQVTKEGILTDNSRSLIDLRWDNKKTDLAFIKSLPTTS